MTGDDVLFLEFEPLSGKDHFKPRPQNRILVPLLRVSFFKISSQHPCPIYMGVSPPPGQSHGISKLSLLLHLIETDRES